MDQIKKKIKNKYIISSVIILIGVITLFTSTLKQTIYEVPISIGEDQKPYVEIGINKETFLVRLNIGTPFPLLLDPTSLKKHGLLIPDSTTWIVMDGKKTNQPDYQIKKTQIGKQNLPNLIASPCPGHYSGELGQMMGSDFQVLLDIPNKKIQFSKNSIPIPSFWISTPFEQTPYGILLKIMTSLGEKRFVISSCSHYSVIHQNQIEPNAIFDSPIFINQEPCTYLKNFDIGNQSYGGMLLHLFNLDAADGHVDGILGLDFLSKYAIYFDTKNNRAWISPPKNHLHSFDFELNKANVPIIHLEINNKKKTLLFDLGYPATLALKKENVEPSDLSPTIHEMTTLNGFVFSTPSYNVNSINLNSFEINSTSIHLFNYENLLKSISVKKEDSLNELQSMDGILGSHILHHSNILIDSKHSHIYATQQPFTLVKMGLLSYQSMIIPFEWKNKIIISVETEFGTKRFSLDTGSTESLWKTDSEEDIIYFNNFTIGSMHCGPGSMKCKKMANHFMCDGILGMDFIKQCQLYIDYSNRVLWIDLINKNPTKKNISSNNQDAVW